MIDKTDPTNRDTVPAMLTPGEFVLNKEATEMYGPVIQQMNNAGLQQRAAENKAMEANMGGGVKYYNTGGLVDFLKKHEGYGQPPNRDKAYQDQAGVWTIGYGRTVNADGSKIKPDQISDEKTEEIFLKDRAEKDYNATVEYGKKYNYNWNDNQINALASFRFNIGNLNELTDNGTRDIATIIKKLPEYNKITVDNEKVISDGLVNRRQAELNLFSNNELPESNQIVTSVRPQTRPETLQKESQPIVMEQPPAALPNPTGYGGYTPQQFLDEAGRINTTTVPSMGDTPPMVQELLPPLSNAGADASFGSAFKEARGQMGAGQVFDYGGKQYTTNFAEEEDMMTANMGGKACSCGKKKVCDCGLGMTYANMGGDIPAQYLNIGDFVRNLMSPFYQKKDKKYLGYGTEPYPYDTVATYPAFTAPGDQGIDVESMTQSNDMTIPNDTPVPLSFNSLQNRAEGIQRNNNIPELQTYEMPTGIPPALLPKVNSDQSILDGSSDSVKDAQRMMMLNNPMPNVLPVSDGNPTPLVPPSVDFPPMDESLRSVPQSVQDSQRMIDINADNAFIPKVNQDTTVPKSNEVDFSMMSTVELLDYLTKTNDPDALLAFEKRPDQNSAIDNAASYVAPNKLDIYQLEKENQTRIDNEVLKRKEILDTSTININKKKNEGTLTEADVDAHNKNRKLFLDLEREAETKRREAASNKLQIKNQETERQESRILQAENDYKADLELKKKLKSFNPETGQYDYNDPVPQNILGESGRGSPYEQYGDQVKARVDKLDEAGNLEDKSWLPNSPPDTEGFFKRGQDSTKEEKQSASNLLSEVFGDLFDTKELARAAIMYLGARATGMSGNQALAFAGKTYLTREASSDKAHQKHLNKLIEDGTMEPASIKLYAKSKDISDLIPKGISFIDMGETKTYFSRRDGTPVQASKMKGSDGSYRWQAPNGQFLKMSMYHLDKDRSKLRSRDLNNAELNQIEEYFTDIQKQFGTVKKSKGSEPAVFATDLVPREVASETMKFAIDNQIPVQAVSGVLRGAFDLARAESLRTGNPIKASKITGYLNSQWIQTSAGDPNDFKIGNDKNSKPVDTTEVNNFVSDLKSKVQMMEPVKFKDMSNILFSQWLRDSELSKSYRNTEANGGISIKERKELNIRGGKLTPPISGYMLFMNEVTQAELRAALASGKQITS